MLGIIGFTDSWNWAAVGKHPALKDYFTLGVLRQVGQGFREWVQAGYERASAREGGASLCILSAEKTHSCMQVRS